MVRVGESLGPGGRERHKTPQGMGQGLGSHLQAAEDAGAQSPG